MNSITTPQIARAITQIVSVSMMKMNSDMCVIRRRLAERLHTEAGTHQQDQISVQLSQ